ncbi:MAG: S8 family serine peptidase [Actinomycetota bacterium]
MRTRHRQAKGALTIAAGALLVGILILSSAFATADAPWPQRSPAQDPNRYEQYGYSSVLPNDYGPGSSEYWKLTGEESNTLYQTLVGLFHPELDRRELEGVMGAGVDKAWSVTTGRPDVVIAVLDTGMAWRDAAAMTELRRKCYLNPGELPPRQAAPIWDANGDGAFNVDDYVGDPRAVDLNGNGVLDPEDIIWAFSDGEDDDGNGYVDDICGWDFLEDDNDPWDETGDGHGTAGAMWSAGEANNASGIAGVCPSAMLLPVRVGDTYIVDANDFAQGTVFAVDSGAWLVQAALVSLNNTPLARDAVDYAATRGVAVIASAGTGESAQSSYPAAYEHAIQVNALQKYAASGSSTAEQFPSSYLYLGGETGYGAKTVVSAPSDGHSSGAAARLAGIAALIYAAAANDVQRGELWNYPGQELPLSACEVKQVIAMTADDIDFSPGYYGTTLGELDSLIGPSERFESHRGWDPYFGYGRVNAYEAVMAVDQGRIPPEAEITYPAWSESLNPGQVTLEVAGRVAAVRAESFHYTVEWAPGWDPADDEWITVSETEEQYEPVEGVLANLDLGEVYGAVLDTMQARGGASDPNRYAFTVRVRVRDNRGNWGEDRRTAYCFDDPDAYAATPVDLSSDISASPRFADIDDDGEDELIVATGAGVVHAYNPDLSEVPGWPVRTAALPLHEESRGYKDGHIGMDARASIAGTPAVGDLDRDGTLEVVVGDMQGRLYAWNAAGELLPGFPVRSNPLYSIPDRTEWWTEGALPAEWFAARLVPDRVHGLDKWNRLDRTFASAPVLCNLDASLDGSLEIVASCADQHLYAWHANGTAVRGWPVKLVDPGKVASLDPLTHTCTYADKDSASRGGKLVAAPCAADLEGDGDIEIICGTGEVYLGEGCNVSPLTFDLGAFLPSLQAFTGTGKPFEPANTRVYAVHHEGAAYGLDASAQPAADKVPAQAFLPGWPVKLATAAPGMLPGILAGVNAAAAAADIDGDGRMEVGISSSAGPGFLLRSDGTSLLGSDEAGLPLSLQSREAGAASPCKDVPLMCAWGSGCFATLGGGALSFFAPTMGLGRAADMYLPADQTRSENAVTAWNAADGSMLAAFPALLNGDALFAAPGAADVDGNGSQEVLVGGAGYDLHAIGADGTEPAGWPRFTAGSSTVTPAVADFDGDGSREVVIGTREGWLFIWKTPSLGGDAADWPQYGHDAWNTGCLGSDAARPGRVMDLSAEALGDGGEPSGVKLAWTAPGDDAGLGQALCYEIRFLDRPIDAGNWDDAVSLTTGKPMPGEPGAPQEYAYDAFPFIYARSGTTFYFALQTRDEAGNFSAISNLATLSWGK